MAFSKWLDIEYTADVNTFHSKRDVGPFEVRTGGKNYYNLIKEFKKQTKFPYVLNTSLNLPGCTLVEDLFDLCYIFENSDLKYIWLPEIKKVIIKHGH